MYPMFVVSLTIFYAGIEIDDDSEEEATVTLGSDELLTHRYADLLNTVLSHFESVEIQPNKMSVCQIFTDSGSCISYYEDVIDFMTS